MFLKRAIILAAILPLFTFAYTSPGTPTGFVSDYAGMLRPETISGLENTLTQLQADTGSEIAIVTIATLPEDETIETYAVKLFEDWGIGDENEDKGILLLIARDNREMRIEVGYGLEAIVTDIESGHIIREILTPSFKNMEYDNGVVSAVVRLEQDIRNGVAPVETKSVVIPDLGTLFYPAVVVIMVMASILGRSKSWWMGGVIGAIVGVLIGTFLGFIFTGIFAIIALSFVGLIFDYFVSRSHSRWKNGGSPPWFMGGGKGGSGGGFGGFGGGMSGGGGASGKW